MKASDAFGSNARISDYAAGLIAYIYKDFERNPMTEGEQHTHEETVKDEHTNEDGKVTQETTEKTEAETDGEDE